MGSQRRNKTTTLAICALLLLSSFDICESAKTSNSKNKSKSGSSSSSSSRTKVSNTQHANPASFSYSNVKPNAQQPVKPSAPVQKPSYPVQSQPNYNQAPYPVQSQPSYNQPPATNTRPVGWNVDQNKPPVNPPYPVNNQAKPNSPPYPTNNQQNNQPIYPQQAPPPAYSNPQQTHQGPPPAYSNYPSNTNYNSPPVHSQYPQQAPPPQYSQYPQQGYPQNSQQGFHSQPSFNPQPSYQQPQFIPVQQQQSSGPGLVKTALISGAAGLGGAALYNAFKSDSDPKTTIIYVNNTQPIAATGEITPPQQIAAQPEQTASNNPAVPQPNQMGYNPAMQAPPQQDQMGYNPAMQAPPQQDQMGYNPAMQAPPQQDQMVYNNSPIMQAPPVEVQLDQTLNITMMQAVPNIPMQDIITQSPNNTLDSTTTTSASSSEETVKKDEMAAKSADVANGPALNTKAQEIVGAEKLPNTAEQANNGISSVKISISIILLSVAYTLF